MALPLDAHSDKNVCCSFSLNIVEGMLNHGSVTEESHPEWFEI